MTYFEKYIKYKTLYLNLCQVGGTSNLIIHICGLPGSGKSTLGERIREHFGTKIVVKDLDDLRDDFISEHYGSEPFDKIDSVLYQKYIDAFVQETHKPIVFVGLNNIPWWDKDLYYNVHPTHTYYIDVPVSELLVRKCKRFFDNTLKGPAIEDLVKNNERFLHITKNGINAECGMASTTEEKERWDSYYKSHSYVFMDADLIYAKVVQIIGS